MENGERVELSRGLSLTHLMMMGMGMMIGAGVFVATGIAIGFAGPGGILVAFALNGLIAFFSAMSFAELASALPTAGGAYTYIDEAFKGLIGFISGWMNWFALTVAGSLYAITFATYTVFLLEGTSWFTNLNLEHELVIKLLALAIALVFVAINYIGVSETGSIENLITLGQMGTLAFIGLFSIYYIFVHPEKLAHFNDFVPNGWDKVLMAMGFTYVGFEGYEVIAHAGEEAVNPKETVPKAILYSVVAVTATYILFAFAAIVGAEPGNVPLTEWFAELGPVGMGEAIKDLMPYGGLLITLAAIFSSTSALNATIYSSTRVLFAISRDGRLPSFFSRIHPVRRVPHYALFASSLIILSVALIFPIEDVAASADIVFLLIFLLVNAAVIRIRNERGDELDYGFQMPYFPYIPLLAILFQAVLSLWVFNVSPTAWAITLTWVAIGLIVYKSYRGARVERFKSEREKVFEEEVEAGARYRIVVAVSNERTAPVLVRYAERIAKQVNGELFVISVVTVPEQTPLEEARQFADGARKVLRVARESVSGDVRVEGIIYYSHSVYRGIMSAVRDKRADLLILGWEGRSRWSKYVLGSNLDRIVRDAPCNVIVIKPGETERKEKVERILFPTRGGRNASKAAELVGLLAESYGANVTVLTVSEAKMNLDAVLQRIPNARLEVRGGNVIEGILRECQKHDLLIMGATREPLFRRLIFGEVPEKVASKCRKTVLLVKINRGIRARINRLVGRRE
ncbi:amino acid transporter [Thermococcus cleftensis]|uniref:Amino acid transporter n=1 Tax=Thermococcus cleftensis (strain DSM 27260 / KACC 17922 / CL1) TaxID=163003 RepID=I3ZWK9_THECF|nr:amino acid permease [Thermococcus cleftensis]AFL96093.1 amino acid transporter [Thermococcus cleftensis]